MNDNRNMVLAIFLSALVLLGWTFLGPKLLPTAAPQTQQVRDGKTHALPQPDSSPAGVPAAGGPTALKVRADVLRATPRVKIETPSLLGSINLVGARIDDLRLLRQRESIAPNSAPVRLLSPAGAPGAYFAGFGWLGDNVAVPGPDTLWQASSRHLAPGQPVTLSWTNPAGLKFEQIFKVDDGYLFWVDQRVTNAGGAPAQIRFYGFANRSHQSADPSSWTNHVGPISVIDGTANYSTKWDTLDKAGAAGVTGTAGTGWVGFTEKYWLTALAPTSGDIVPSFRRTPTGGYQADYAGPGVTIAPGQTVNSQTRLFAGAKEKAVLDRYEDAGITKLSKSIDWGWFEFFMRPIFGLLRWLFAVTGNFGVAIICLTFIVRAVMFPIAQRQFQSTLGMRRVQPKLKALQARYKDDKPRQQQEVMKLYKEEKINPAAGCLPIFLQIPVFYALYKVLMVAVEMRHQPFAGWIHDLSAPDPMSPVNLFGLLHFTPPHLLAIGILPILVGATQWMTIKMNPATGVDPAQQQIMALMPWFLVFVMAPFAAGLQLYWVTNNLLTLAQQSWFNHKHPVDAATAIVDAKPVATKPAKP